MSQTTTSNLHLVIKMRALGDTVMASAAAQLLHEKTGASVDILVPRVWAPALQESPFLHRIIGIDEPRGFFKSLFFWVRVVSALRLDHYQHVVVLHASFKTALVGRLVAMGRGSCAINHHELNPGFIKKWIYQTLFSTVAVPDRGQLKPNLHRDLDPLRALGLEVKNSEAKVHLHVTDNERNEATDRLKAAGWNGTSPLMFLGVGASRTTKRWPAHKMQEFIHFVGSRDKRWVFVICSLASDEPWLKEFYVPPVKPDNILHFKDLALREAMAVLARCTAYVGNDSGFKHVAVGLDVTTVTIFGPENPVEWHPYTTDRNPILYREGLVCRTVSGRHWCDLDVCTPQTQYKHACLEEIEVSEVVGALSTALTVRKTGAKTPNPLG